MSITGNVEVRQLNKGRTLLIQAILDGLDALEYARAKKPEAYKELVQDAQAIYEAAFEQTRGRLVAASAIAAACLARLAAMAMYGEKVKELRGTGFEVCNDEVETPCAKT